MKFLNDKNEYITWMIEEVFMTTRKELEEETSFLDWQEDVLPEIEKNCPEFFPCVAYLKYQPEKMLRRSDISCISTQQIQEWAALIKSDSAPVNH
ncbi:hypothetical protein [Dryocola sp. BD626]|uniref:hypothetical protein n=1 Tax=Dryocola sp. BD626 TaxID=3133273 RepID=UPI003F4FDAF4